MDPTKPDRVVCTSRQSKALGLLPGLPPGYPSGCPLVVSPTAASPGAQTQWRGDSDAAFENLLQTGESLVQVALGRARDQRLHQAQQARRASGNREPHTSPVGVALEVVDEGRPEWPGAALDPLMYRRFVLDDLPVDLESRPIDRIRVRTVLPTPIGSGEVSSSLPTLSSQLGRLRASDTNANTSSSGRAMTTATLRVNTGRRCEGTPGAWAVQAPNGAFDGAQPLAARAPVPDTRSRMRPSRAALVAALAALTAAVAPAAAAAPTKADLQGQLDSLVATKGGPPGPS